MKTVAQRNREVKKFLSGIYGSKNVRVKGGTGTAYGWMIVDIKRDDESTVWEIERKIVDFCKLNDFPLYTYTSYDSYGVDNYDILVKVENRC